MTVNNNARITVKNGGTGLSVGGTATANLTNMTIAGGGQGKGVIMESTGTMTMTNVNISKVKVGVWVTSGNLTVNMGEIKDVQTGIT
ncbi:hypothetical protein, partial [Bartonella bovis]|uniref:hypothetical protein n=1 Tax=Bartonella bovis TaxID=155194 RepID=UPI001958FD59